MPDSVAALGERLHREFPTVWHAREDFWKSVAREALAFTREQLLTLEEMERVVGPLATVCQRHGCMWEAHEHCEDALANRDARLARLGEALNTWGSHLVGCLANEIIARRLYGDDRVEYGMPNGVGTYREAHDACSCGFTAARADAGVGKAK